MGAAEVPLLCEKATATLKDIKKRGRRTAATLKSDRQERSVEVKVLDVVGFLEKGLLRCTR